MDSGILYNLSTIVMNKLIAKGRNINGKSQREDSGDPPPGWEAGSIVGDGDGAGRIA
jgi:hypothetical protein